MPLQFLVLQLLKMKKMHGILKMRKPLASLAFPDLYVLISHCNTSHEAWDALKQTYDRPSESRKIQLQYSLEDLRYNDFKSMDEFLLKFASTKSQLIGLGVTLADIRLITIILKKCLPKPFQ